MSPDLTLLGDKVRRERIRLGLTAEQAAELGQVAFKTWLRIESGKPVRNMSLSAVDRLLGLVPGTTLRSVARGRSLSDVPAVVGEGAAPFVAASVRVGRMRILAGFEAVRS